MDHARSAERTRRVRADGRRPPPPRLLLRPRRTRHAHAREPVVQLRPPPGVCEARDQVRDHAPAPGEPHSAGRLFPRLRDEVLPDFRRQAGQEPCQHARGHVVSAAEEVRRRQVPRLWPRRQTGLLGTGEAPVHGEGHRCFPEREAERGARERALGDDLRPDHPAWLVEALRHVREATRRGLQNTRRTHGRRHSSGALRSGPDDHYRQRKSADRRHSDRGQSQGRHALSRPHAQLGGRPSGREVHPRRRGKEARGPVRVPGARDREGRRPRQA